MHEKAASYRLSLKMDRPKERKMKNNNVKSENVRIYMRKSENSYKQPFFA